MTNCLIVALRLWLAGARYDWIAYRRSKFWGGIIPHAAHITEHGEEIIVTQYGPPVMPGDAGPDSQLCFDGYYSVKRYRLVSEGRAKSLTDARKAIE